MKRRSRQEFDVSCCIEVERSGEMIDVDVKGTYVPGMPGVHTLPNGDPGYEAEPAEVYISSVLDSDKKHIELTAKELDMAEEGLFEDASDKIDFDDSDDEDDDSGEVNFDDDREEIDLDDE